MTIAESYREYRGGKINKAQFMERARKDHHLKGLVTNVMSFQDTVQVLKNKGIISESVEEAAPIGFTDRSPRSKVQTRANVVNRFRKAATDAETEEEYRALADMYKKLIDKERKSNISPREIEQILIKLGKFDTVIDMVTGRGFTPPAETPSTAASTTHEMDPELADLIKKKDELFYKLLAGELTKAQYKKEIGDIPQRIKAFYNPVWAKQQGLREGVEIIPAELRKGINFELGLIFQAIPDWDDSFVSPDQMKKAENKALKNLEKDSLYYTKLIATGEKPKKDEPEMEIEYKESNVSDTTNKTKGDGFLKKELKKDEDSNVQTSLSKSEAKSGKPEGVKQMKEAFMPGVDLGASFEKMKGSMGAEEEFENLMKSYDWYHEMSDDPSKWEKGQEIEMKLKDLADIIGPEKAVEIYNRYAPQGAQGISRQVSTTHFAKEGKIAKLKETLKKKVKEAMRYSIGRSTGITTPDIQYKASTDPDLEKQLRAARVPFTKKTI